MNIYICTKPLQIMICMILCKNYDSDHLYVVDYFYDSQKISNSEELKKSFKTISWFKTKKEAIAATAVQHPDSIFIDSDVGVQNLITLCRLKIRSIRTEINVYEEGLGTYRTDIVTNKIKKKIFFIFGVGYYFGGCFLTKKIYVLDLNLYKERIPSLKQKAIAINIDFSIWLYENKSKLIKIFSPCFEIVSSGGADVAYLYLSDWNVDMNFINKTKKLGNLFVKLHPHTKEEACFEGTDEYIIIPRSLPAEIAIISILEKFNMLTVYHKDSSCMRYLRHEKISSVII